MKITTLLETNTTPSSDPAANQSQQAPKFGRDPNVLEDEQLDEMTAGATGSGSVATGEPTNMGVQRRGKGSMLQGIKTSKKFPNSAAVKEGVAEGSLNETPTIDFIRGLISEFNEQMSGSPYYPMDYKNPGMRMWTRGDGSRYKDPGYIFIERDLKPEDQPKWHKAKAVEKFWKFLESKGARKIGDVSGEFGSDPHSPAVVLNKLIFVFNGRSIAWGSTSRLKNSSVWRQKQQGVAEGYIFKGGFPFDVDHMPGSVIRNRDETTDVIKTKNKDKWDDEVDRINDEVFDDMADFTTDSKGETVTGNSAVWAKWDNATQTGWINRKGNPLKPWPVKEQGVAEGSDNIRSMIQQYEDMVELVYDLPPGRKKNIAIDKRDALEAQIEAMPGGSEALRKWARAYNDSFDEGVAEDSIGQEAFRKDREAKAEWIKNNPLMKDKNPVQQQAAWAIYSTFHKTGTDKNKEQSVDEGYDKWGWHTSVTNGEFMPTKYGNKAYVYLHDLDNQSATGKPQLVTVNKPTVAKRIAKQFGGKVVKTDLNTYRIVKPAVEGVAEANWHTEPEQEKIDATRQARLNREREPAGSDKIDRMLAQRYEQEQEYNRSGKFWLKTKDTQRHVEGPFIGKEAARQAAVDLFKRAPELKGNLLITAWGPDETPVTEAELSEEQLLAKDLKKQLELFKKSIDHELGDKPKDKEIQKKK